MFALHSGKWTENHAPDAVLSCQSEHLSPIHFQCQRFGLIYQVHFHYPSEQTRLTIQYHYFEHKRKNVPKSLTFEQAQFNASRKFHTMNFDICSELF